MKTIMVSDEAYEKLAAIKGKKSFTELVSELVEKTKGTKFGDIEMFFGIMSEKDAEERRRFIARYRKNFKARSYEAIS